MNISSEEKLILLCSTTSMDYYRQKRIRDLLKFPLDWTTVIDLSKHHAIITLLYYNLSRLSFLNVIPEGILQILKDTYLTNLIRNITLHKEFNRISDLARQRGIKVLPFKGMALTDMVYHNPALRVFADIDILIKEGDLSKFKTLLLDRGYREIKQRHTFLFTKIVEQGIYVNLEIHTMFIPPRPYKIQIPQLWQRSEEKIIHGQRLNFLSREDTFLSLILHLRRHTRILLLKFICDAAELLNLYKGTLDWGYVQNLAKKNHIKNSVYFCLYICQELLGIYVNDELISNFRPGLFKRKFIYLCMNEYNFLKPKPWQGYALRFLLFDRLSDFLFYIWRVILKERYFG